MPEGTADGVRRVLERAIRRVAPRWLAPEYEDLVQSAYARVLRATRSEESGGPSTSYLWRAAHSVVMDELRRRRRHRETPLEHDETGSSTACDSAAPSQESVEIREMIERGLSTLSHERRAAVLLFLYGFGLEESAQMLGWTPKQLGNQRYRGLEELRRFLAERGYRP